MAIKKTGFMGDRHDLQTARPASPSPGNPLTWTPPANSAVQVVAVSIGLLTSATAGDRLMWVYSQNGTGIMPPYSPAGIIQDVTAVTWHYHFSVGIGPLDFDPGATGSKLVFAPLACCYQLKGGESLIVNAFGLDVLDRMVTPVIRYFDWKEE